MPSSFLRGLACLAALTGVIQGGPAAAPLPAPNAILTQDFTRIVAIRELSDGRVLVSDAGDRKLLLVDMASGTVAALGREGKGPGEYSSVGRLYALAGDSTLLLDQAGARWLLPHGEKIVQTVGAGEPAIREGVRQRWRLCSHARKIGLVGPPWVLVLCAACARGGAAGGGDNASFAISYPDAPPEGSAAKVGKRFYAKPEGRCLYENGREARWTMSGARVTSGELPPGLTLEDGVIGGVPTQPGSYTAHIESTCPKAARPPVANARR